MPSARRVRIPPHTAQVIDYSLNSEMPDFIIELANDFPSGILASRTYNASVKAGKLCVMSMTDRSHIVKTGSVVGEAMYAHALPERDFSLRRVTVEKQKSYDHVKSLLQDLEENAPTEIRTEAKDLVKEFPDIFVYSDLDLGNFSEIENTIDTS